MKNKAANAPIAFAEIIMVMIKCGMDFASHLKKISLNINTKIRGLRTSKLTCGYLGTIAIHVMKKHHMIFVQIQLCITLESERHKNVASVACCRLQISYKISRS